MKTIQPRVERRKWPRAYFSAKAHVFHKNNPTKILSVNNLSAGGALLVGDADLLIGDKIRLTIDIPEFSLLKLNARVLQARTTVQGEPAFRIAFYNIDPSTEDVIHNAVLARLEAVRVA